MGFMTQAFFNETGRTLFCYQLTSIDWISTFWMMGEGEDRSQSLFYFVPQEKNLTAKQAWLGWVRSAQKLDSLDWQVKGLFCHHRPTSVDCCWIAPMPVPPPLQLLLIIIIIIDLCQSQIIMIMD